MWRTLTQGVTVDMNKYVCLYWKLIKLIMLLMCVSVCVWSAFYLVPLSLIIQVACDHH